MEHRPLGVQIARMLADRGIAHVFGIPGVHNIELYRGLAEAGITHVLARHEQGAGFMADGYARATGQPGVAFVITGPGLCNIMNPMGQAYSDSVPMLVISSCLDETAAKRGQLHQMRDQRAAAETVCTWSEEARTAEAAYALIDRALAELATERPRPRHIQVPIALLTATAPPPPQIMPHPQRASDMADVVMSEFLRYLASAERPLFIFGGGTRGDLASSILDRTGAACFMTYAGRGSVDPVHLRNFGAYLGRPGSAATIASADLVIAIGSELSEVDLFRDKLGHDGPMIRVDIDPEVLARGDADLAIMADSCRFLAALHDLLDDHQPADGWDHEEVTAARARWRGEVDANRPGIVPICDALAAALPDDLMIYSDMTQFAYTAKEVWPMARAGHWHHPFGFGTLGYALPAAIGGAIARKGQPTLAIAGDSGFQYSLQELGTAVEHGLSLPILLWDNGALAEIRDAMTGAQIEPTAVTARNPDFLALARAYGVLAVQPQTIDALIAAIMGAFSADGPTLIRVTPDITIGWDDALQ